MKTLLTTTLTAATLLFSASAFASPATPTGNNVMATLQSSVSQCPPGSRSMCMFGHCFCVK